MTAIEQNGVTFVRADNLAQAGGTVHGFSTRLGGVSEGIYESLNLSASRGDDPDHVRENFRRLCVAVGTDMDKMVLTRQMHGSNIRTVTMEDIQRDVCIPPEEVSDALITQTPNLTLMVFTADCIPILLYDPKKRAVAAIHAGWRGTADNIAGQTVEKLGRDFGSSPGDLIAAIGPGICRNCFQTDSDVPQEMQARLGGLVRPFFQKGPGEKFRVDLKGINAALLQQAGVPAEQIECSDECTACLPQRYWSHRFTKGKRGNQGAVIMLLPE